MNLGKLKSFAHNLADSVASGMGFMIGVYQMNVFAEAASSDEGHILVNFLNASTTGSAPSIGLQKAFGLYRDALPWLFEKHGLNLSEVRVLQVRHETDAACGPHFTVTVETVSGKRSVDQYVGIPGRRLRRRRA